MAELEKSGTGRLILRIMLGSILLFVIPLMSLMTNAEDGLVTTELNIGFPTSSFRTVNNNDAKAAVRVWIDTVGRNRGYDLVGETRIFNDAAEMYQEIREDRLDLVIIQAWDYIDFLDEQLLKPVYAPAGRGADLDHYLLLVRGDRRIGTLDDLRGKNIALLQCTGVNYARQWLDTRVGEEGLGRSETFFESVSVVEKVSSAVLPVFFGKIDACVVDGSGFEIMKGMNPQLGKQLQTLTVSPPLIETIICMHRHGHEHEDDMVRAMGELDREPRGRQILLVFKIDRLLPFDPADLESLATLRDKYLELNGTETSLAESPDQFGSPSQSVLLNSARSHDG